MTICGIVLSLLFAAVGILLFYGLGCFVVSVAVAAAVYAVANYIKKKLDK